MSRSRTAGRGLILLAHGSPDPRHARDLAHLRSAIADLMARGSGDPGDPGWIRPDLVSLAYLDHHGPTPQAAAQELLARGASEAQVLPVFTAAAYHLRVDVPRALAVMRAGGLPTAAVDPGMAGNPALVRLALSGQEGRPLPRVLFAAGSSSAAACATLQQQVASLAGSAAPLATAFLAGGPDLGAALAQVAGDGSAPEPEGAGDVRVVPFVMAEGILRDRMATAAANYGLALEPGILATHPGMADLVAGLLTHAQPGSTGHPSRVA